MYNGKGSTEKCFLFFIKTFFRERSYFLYISTIKEETISCLIFMPFTHCQRPITHYTILSLFSYIILDLLSIRKMTNYIQQMLIKYSNMENPFYLSCLYSPKYYYKNECNERFGINKYSDKFVRKRKNIIFALQK